MEDDLVLFLADVGTGESFIPVGVGDRLTLDAYLFALDRDRLGDVLGDYIFAQSGAAGFMAC